MAYGVELVGDPNWAGYSRVHHNLMRHPDPEGWTVGQVAVVFGVSMSYAANILNRLVAAGCAIKEGERYSSICPHYGYDG